MNFKYDYESSGGLLGCILILAIVAGLFYLIPVLICWAWSLFAPAIFGLPLLNWWQAAGMWLFSILVLHSGHSPSKK